MKIKKLHRLCYRDKSDLIPVLYLYEVVEIWGKYRQI